MAAAGQTRDESPSPEVIDPPSTPAPVAAASPEPSSDPSPDPAPAQEPTPDGAPRPSAPPRLGPHLAAPSHQRGRNRRPPHGRGNRGPFFPATNGRNFNRLPAPNWSPGFGFAPMWPPHQLMGVPLGVPVPSGAALNYYGATLPPVPVPLPHYGGSFYPELNGPFYPFPPLLPGVLPLGAAPVGPHAPPPPPTPTKEDLKAALPPTPPPPPPPPMNEDEQAALQGKNLLAELRKQIEYYFSDANLVQDGHLKKQMDDEGWVDIETIAKFPRVASKTADLEVIKEALSSSDSVELQDSKLRKKDGWASYCIPKN